MVGFELVVNFRQPYLALSPSDFWQRWHISLSTWLRDYLYIPLGGNRGGAWLTYRNLMLTMLLGGLWHGASWTFVGWGLYHGAILCLFRAFRIRDPQWTGGVGNKVYYAFRLLVMFHLTCIGWLLFRAQDFGSVIAMLGPMLTDVSYHSGLMTPIALIGLYCGPLLVLEWYLDGEERATMLTNNVWLWRGLVYSYALVMMLVCHAEVAAEFIYFQF